MTLRATKRLGSPEYPLPAIDLDSCSANGLAPKFSECSLATVFVKRLSQVDFQLEVVMGLVELLLMASSFCFVEPIALPLNWFRNWPSLC